MFSMAGATLLPWPFYQCALTLRVRLGFSGAGNGPRILDKQGQEAWRAGGGRPEKRPKDGGGFFSLKLTKAYVSKLLGYKDWRLPPAIDSLPKSIPHSHRLAMELNSHAREHWQHDPLQVSKTHGTHRHTIV